LLDDGGVFAAVKRPVRESSVPFALRLVDTSLAMGENFVRLGGLRRGLRECGEVQRTQSVVWWAVRDLDYVMRSLVFVISETGQAQDAGGIPDGRISAELPRKAPYNGLGMFRRKILDLP
jgi:hypothetical protein